MGSGGHVNVDVVIVSYNSSEHLRRCVGAIVGRPDLNVIVVDNASHDRSVESIADLPVTIVVNPGNAGFARACNRGWRMGAAPYVLFLNPDTTIVRGAIDELVHALAADDQVGVVGPRLVNEEGALELSQHRFPSVASTFGRALYLHRVPGGSAFPRETVTDLSAYALPGPVDWLPGACLLVRRDLLVQTGGLDEDFFMYSEDVQLCRDAWSRGLSVQYVPSAEVTHVGGASGSRARLLPELARSRAIYVSKNYSGRVAYAIRLGLVVESITHALVGRGGWSRRFGYLAALRTTVDTRAGRVMVD